MEHIFLNNKEGRPKAIKQLVNSIAVIRSGEFDEDKGIDHNNNVIYPIIITHNSVFSLSGINALIDEWFFNELELKGIDKKNIKNLTIIEIDTLILFQGLISQKNNSIRELINSYWKNYMTVCNKKYLNTEDEVNEYPIRFQSFNMYVKNIFKDKNVLTKEVKRYDDYFH